MYMCVCEFARMAHLYLKKCGNKNTGTVNACGVEQSRRARFPWGLSSRSRVPNIEGRLTNLNLTAFSATHIHSFQSSHMTMGG